MTRINGVRAATLGFLLLVFALGLGLRLHQLDADSFWRDEIDTVTVSQLPLVSLPEALAEDGTFPPLLYIVTHFFIRIAGDSESIVRLPAALLGAASILLIYKVGTMLWSGREGLLAAFLLAVNPWHVRYSQEARWYAAAVFLALLSLIFLLRALQSSRSGAWLGFALVSSMATYNHYFAWLVLPAQVAFAAWMIWTDRSSDRPVTGRAVDDHVALLDRSPEPTGQAPSCASVEVHTQRSQPVTGSRRQIACLTLSLLLVAVSYIPWLPSMYRQVTYPNIGYRGVGVPTEETVRSASQFYQGMLQAHSGVDGVLVILFLVLFLLGLACCSRQQALLTVLWAATPFLFFSLLQARHWLHPRYGIHILPIYLLLVARGVDAAGHYLGRYAPGKVASSIAPMAVTMPLAILVSLLQVAPLGAYYNEAKTDWRSAARFLADHMQLGDIIVADGMEFRTGRDDTRVGNCLPYYLSVYGVDSAPILFARPWLWHGLEDLEQWNGQLWAVVWHPDELENVEIAQVAQLHQIAVIRLREPSGHPLRDAQSLLQVLLESIPDGEAHFDIHLSLANFYIRTGQLERAKAQVHLASLIEPDVQQASDALGAERAHLQWFSGRLEGMTAPLWRNVGEELAMLGYNLRSDALKAGDTVELIVWWRALHNTDRDYTAFVHVVDLEGLILVQQDSLLQLGRQATSAWEVGDIAREQYELVLPADLPPGKYDIVVGVYYWETGERLPVWDEDGQRLPQDAIPTHRVHLVQSSD